MTQPNIPGYRIIRPLSESRRANVYLAEQTSLQRTIALKILNIDVSRDEGSRRRVIDEGKSAARLTHPNLLGVFDIGESEGRHYIATEYVSGGTLRDKLNQGPISLDQALAITRDLANGLAFLHTSGFLHRDIKPTNILFREDGMAVLGESGVSRAVGANTPEPDVAFGSPHYMSPERAQAMPSDGRSDLYSLGVVLWEILTGSPPFDDEDPFTVAISHISAPVPKLTGALTGLQPLIERLMAKLPENRLANAGQLVSALEQNLAARSASLQTTAHPIITNQSAATAPPKQHPLSQNAAPSAEAPTPELTPKTQNAKAQSPETSVMSLPQPMESAVSMGEATKVVEPIKAPKPVPQATRTALPPAIPPANASNETIVAPMPPIQAKMPAPPMPPPAAPMQPERQFTAPQMPASAGFPPSGLPMEVQAPVAKNSVSKKSSSAGWLLWIGVIGLLSALAAGVWYYRQTQKKPMQPPSVNQNQLGDAGASTQTTIADLLKKAESRERGGDLIVPEDDCAAHFYKEALALDPNNSSALVGIEGVLSTIDDQIVAAISEGTQAKARGLIEAAQKHFPDNKRLKELNQSIQ